jgi:hypothetical protein
MRHARLAKAFLLITLAIVPDRVRAQDLPQPWADSRDLPGRVDLSASVGVLMPTRWSDLVLLGSISPAAGALEQVLTRDLRVEPDRGFSGALTYWRGRYGFRAQAGFSRSTLTVGSLPAAATPLAGADVSSVGIDTWLYDVGGAIGMVDYKPGRSVWPYGFVGLGGITYDLKKAISPPLAFVQRGPSGNGSGNIFFVGDTGRQFLLAVDELSRETVFALNAGAGVNFQLPLGRGGVGLRLEVADHVATSPVRLQIRDLSSLGAVVSDEGVRFPIVHHLSATAGVVPVIVRGAAAGIRVAA